MYEKRYGPVIFTWYRRPFSGCVYLTFLNWTMYVGAYPKGE